MATRTVRIHLNEQIIGLNRHLHFEDLDELGDVGKELSEGFLKTEKAAAPAAGYVEAIKSALTILKRSTTYTYIDLDLQLDVKDNDVDDVLRKSVFGVIAPGWVRIKVRGYRGHQAIANTVRELQLAAGLVNDEYDLGLGDTASELSSLEESDYAEMLEDKVFDIPERVVSSVERRPIKKEEK